VAGNACDSNGLGVGNGAGIYVILAGNRIDGNNVTDADWGIKVDEPGNLIIRNSASGNTTNYFFIGTQTFGPTNTVTGEINPTNTSPWANFSF
jgi:parallel beta-helix repeat protein